MHRLLIENRATKEVEALHGEMLDRVVKAIGSLKQNPRPHGVKKLFVEDGWRERIKMRFRRGTCGLCKPTKRYKTNSTRRSQKFKKAIQQEITSNTSGSINLREINPHIHKISLLDFIPFTGDRRTRIYFQAYGRA